MLKKCISQNELNRTVELFQLQQKWGELKDLLELWAFDDYNIKLAGAKILMYPSLKSYFKTYFLSSIRHESLRISKNNQIAYIFSKINQNNNPKNTSIPRFKTEIELANYIAIREELFSKTGTEKCLNISINDWIKAYTVLLDFSKKYDTPLLCSKNISEYYSLEDFLIVKKRPFWIKLFIKAGINKDSSEVIFNNLIFNNNSSDILDAPLIKVGEEFALFTTTAHVIFPVYSFISNVTKSGDQRKSLEFKRDNFADYFKQVVKKAGIECYSIPAKKSNINDCDAVFILENNLFIVECKVVFK